MREKTKHFPNPIASIHDYLGSKDRYQEFYQSFRAVTRAEFYKLQEWTKHPDWERTLQAMRDPQVGVVQFVWGVGELGQIPDDVRVAMKEFAVSNGYVNWGASKNG